LVYAERVVCTDDHRSGFPMRSPALAWISGTRIGRPVSSSTAVTISSTGSGLGGNAQRSKIMLQLDWESEGMIEKLGSAIGQDDRQAACSGSRNRSRAAGARRAPGAARSSTALKTANR
jgi:hypothetical protein